MDNTETLNQNADPLLYSVQEAYDEMLAAEAKENSQEKPDPQQVDDADAPKPGAKDDGEVVDEPAPEADDVEGESDSSVPELDAEVAKLSPHLQKRWQQQWKGVLKREKEVGSRETEFKSREEHFTNLSQVEARLADSTTALDTYRRLGHLLKETHGYTDAQLLGDTPRADAGGDAVDLDNLDFEYESDAHVYRRAVQDAVAKAIAQTREEFAPFLQELEEVKATKAHQTQEAQNKQYLDKVASRTIKQISAEDSGWKVTPAMVSEALAAYPQHKEDPARAVRALFSDERAAHMAEVSAKHSVTPSTDLLPGTNAGGYKQVAPEDYSMAHAYRELFGKL